MLLVASVSGPLVAPTRLELATPSPSTQATLRQWKDAYSRRDLDRALAVVAPDDDVVGIGTGPDEWRVGPEAFKAQLECDLAQTEALSVDYEPLVRRRPARRPGWLVG